MGQRTQHTPGTFSWVDLTTTDQQGAKDFYAGLLGWDYDDRPMGDDVYYSMARRDGLDVAAISPQPRQQREAGAPPLWNSYVTVASADDAAARAGELGAHVHAPPFDVFDAGRMTVIRDPQGAHLCLWEPRENIGAKLVNAPGALCWNELMTPDVEASAAFYGDLFGWTTVPFEDSPAAGYRVIQNGERGNGGMLTPPSGAPTSWLVYFAVGDLDAAQARVGELGGTVHGGQMELPMAKLLVAQDPQGAMFALYAGKLDE